MQRKVYLLPIFIVFVIALSSCNASNKMPDVNEYIEGTDFPYYYLSSNGEMRIAKSEQGYYILNGQYIYFMEEDGDEPILLDNRPNHECFETKDGENCDAYVQNEQFSSILFQFYNGYLYFIEAITEKDNPSMLDVYTYELVQMSPDGSKRKVIRTFDQATIHGAAIHRGDLYYVTEDYDKDNKQAYQIARVPLLKGKKEAEILVDATNKNRAYSSILPYGTQLYFVQSGDVNAYMRYDLIDGTLTEVPEQPDEIADPNVAATIQMIFQEKLYFYYFDTGYYGDIDEPVKEGDPTFDPLSLKFYSADLDGSNVKETNIPSTEIISEVYHDQRYTYVRPLWFAVKSLNRDENLDIPDEIKIYQNENELVHTVDTTDFTLQEDFIAGDERYMFMWDHDLDSDEDDSYVIYKFYYLDKNEIETGKAKFKQLLENKIGDGGGIFDLNE